MMEFPKLQPLDQTDTHRPLVSVVMPTYRRSHIIGDSIDSILKQTINDFELIIQDDYSPDNTEQVVANFKDARIRYIRNERNLKMPGNLNEGIRHSKGVYIMVCHDHDLYHPTLLEKMVRLFDEYPNVIYVHTGNVVIDQDGQEIGRNVESWDPVTLGRTWSRFMLSNYASHFACPVTANSMVRRQTYGTYGLYNAEFGFISDVEMWLRLCLHGDVGYIAEPLIKMCTREANHEYARVRWDLIATTVQIYEHYCDLVYRGRERLWYQLNLLPRLEFHYLRRYLSCVRRRDSQALREGKSYLRQAGGPVSRIAAYLL